MGQPILWANTYCTITMFKDVGARTQIGPHSPINLYNSSPNPSLFEPHRICPFQSSSKSVKAALALLLTSQHQVSLDHSVLILKRGHSLVLKPGSFSLSWEWEVRLTSTTVIFPVTSLESSWLWDPRNSGPVRKLGIFYVGRVCHLQILSRGLIQKKSFISVLLAKGLRIC